jgi:hypothetical protein
MGAQVKNGRRKKSGVAIARLPQVQSHLRMAGTVVDIVNVRVPSTMDWLRAAGIHVSESAQKETCRAVFRSLCNDVEFCSQLTTQYQGPSAQVISGYIDRHIQEVVGRALRCGNGP